MTQRKPPAATTMSGASPIGTTFVGFIVFGSILTRLFATTMGGDGPSRLAKTSPIAVAPTTRSAAAARPTTPAMAWSDAGIDRRRTRRSQARLIEFRVLSQDRALELLQRPAGGEAEFLGEHSAGLLIRSKGLRLPPRAVEGEHELSP